MNDSLQQFDQVVFDRKNRVLAVAGRPVELERSGAAILATLLDAAGEDVSKDRLLEAGWPGRIVDENSLAKAISRLRRALGEDGRALETVHGYRIAAEVRHTVPASPQRLRPASRLPRRAAAIAGAVLFLAAAGSMAALSDQTKGKEPSRVVNGEAPDSIGRVLWVDDNPANNVAEMRFLENRKVAIYQVSNSRDALALLAMYDYGAVISDMGRGERPLAGIDLARAMRARENDTPFFLYTVHSSDAQRKLVAAAGGQSVAETRDELYSAILPLFSETRAGN